MRIPNNTEINLSDTGIGTQIKVTTTLTVQFLHLNEDPATLDERIQQCLNAIVVQAGGVVLPPGP